MEVQIRHSGNLIEISPASVEPLLQEKLEYWYRSMNHDPRADNAGKMTFQRKRIYRVDGDRILCLQGVLQRVLDTLNAAGCHTEYTDLREPKVLITDEVNLARYIPEQGLRHGQGEILSLVEENFFGQFEAPTGYGKTELIVMLAAYFPKARIIICSPSISLMKDTYPRLLAVTPSVSRTGGGKKETPGRVVLTTDKSLLRVPVDQYDMLFFDEVHRAASGAASKVLAQVRHTRMFGFSATTRKRGDGADLRTEALFGPVLFEMSYADAQARGYVSPIKYYMADLTEHECDINSANWDLPAYRKMNCYWYNQVRNLKLMRAAATIPVQLGMPPDAQIMVAVETLSQAYALKRIAPDYEVVYAERDRKDWERERTNGKIPQDEIFLDKERREQFRQDFSAGRLRKVICTPTWSTGMNFTSLDIIVSASGATSQILTIQWGGRASRVREGKDFALIIDCADQWDPWAKRRAGDRRRSYNQKGWTPVTVGTVSAYRQESLL